jgi:Arc/MetJ family transcription regulator
MREMRNNAFASRGGCAEDMRDANIDSDNRSVRSVIRIYRLIFLKTRSDLVCTFMRNIARARARGQRFNVEEFFDKVTV